jgi:hypothetical protein
MQNVRRLIYEEYQRQRAIPFAWGSSDCGLFVADVAKLLTGRDPAEGFRGTYDSKVGIKRIMVENGWQTLGDGAAAMYPEIPVALAKNGDWVFVVNHDGTETLGVVCGAQILARAEEGLGIHPLTMASRAFRVLE